MIYRAIYYLHIFIENNVSHNSLVVRVYRRLSEKILTIYFISNPFKPCLSHRKSQKETIVSLTTFPARIDKVWLVIESILYQTQRPDRILLWLFDGEFGSKDQLPARLLALEKRGVEIRFCTENLMPHKKYFYTLKENPSSNIITVDDDVFYPPNLIHILKTEHKRNSKAILCAISREIKLENNEPKAYTCWPMVTKSFSPKFKYLPIGVGGTFYPAGCLHDEVLNDENIKDIALKADDLWLKVMSLLAGTKVKSIAGRFPYSYLPVYHQSKQKLMDSNIGSGNNDKVFKKLLFEYNIDLKEYLNSGL